MNTSSNFQAMSPQQQKAMRLVVSTDTLWLLVFLAFNIIVSVGDGRGSVYYYQPRLGVNYQWILVLLPALIAVWFARKQPLTALVLMLLSFGMQLASMTDFYGVQATYFYVMYYLGRSSNLLHRRLGLTVALALPMVMTLYALKIESWILMYMFDGASELSAMITYVGIPYAALNFLLVLPWLVGTVVQRTVSAERAIKSRDEAEDRASAAAHMARIRDEHATLAREVHDVVGHSLAVIVTQADSVRFMDDSDPAAVRRAVDNIAQTARTSLSEVRTVLNRTDLSTPRPGTDHSLEDLIRSVANSGRDVQHTIVGEPTVITGEAAAHSYRVLQEMLTNALKHGVQNTPIQVEQEWTVEALSISVINERGTADDGFTRGRGIDGMHTRVKEAGGSLVTRTLPIPGSTNRYFLASASFPLEIPPARSPETGYLTTKDVQ